MAQFDSSQLKKIGVYTSGGDAPGMNAAIRAVVRAGIHYSYEVVGCIGGYQGMLEKEFKPLNRRSVANIIQRGGTILKSKRCPDFLQPEVRAKAATHVRGEGIEALVCIGGDGSFRGGEKLWIEHQIPVVGIPGTIDNDIYGTEVSVGFDTAVNTALEAIDRIRDTAASHNRLFIVEVMGKDSGFIATTVGLAGGAEEIFIPEHPVTLDRVVEIIKSGMSRGKTSSILVTAEGQKPGRAYDLAEGLRKRSGFEAKVCILGHIQRGGRPTATDRVLASRLGCAAVEQLKSGQCNLMVGLQNNQLATADFSACLQNKKEVLKELINLTPILSR